jgi:hypothetical protein
MQQHNDHFLDNHLAAVRSRLAEGLRAEHDLMEPLAPRFVELLQQLEAKALERDTAEARIYAELEESIAALIHAAPRKPLKPSPSR